MSFGKQHPPSRWRRSKPLAPAAARKRAKKQDTINQQIQTAQGINALRVTSLRANRAGAHSNTGTANPVWHSNRCAAGTLAGLAQHRPAHGMSGSSMSKIPILSVGDSPFGDARPGQN
jgi:hypothetical protein